MIGMKDVLLLWFKNILIKKTSGSGVNNEIKQYQQLAEELHMPIIKKLKKELYSEFKDNIWGVDLADMRLISTFNKDNIWGADLADMRLISTFNKGTRFLLCVIDSSSKYAWFAPLKDKKRYNYC